MIVDPPDIDPAPAKPSRNDRVTFPARSEGWRDWEAIAFEQVEQAAAATHANALDAQQSALTTAAAAAVAAGASNFKGNWADLAGALNKPACVKHSGRFWLLRNNLANVAASTPSDMSADWISMDTGIRPTSVITSNTLAVVGVLYLIAANGITLTAPTSWLKGDFFGFREVAGLRGAVVAMGATKVRGRTPGNVYIDVPYQGIDLVYEDATRGLV